MVPPSSASLTPSPPQILIVPKEEVAVEEIGGVNNSFSTLALPEVAGENALAPEVMMNRHLAPSAKYKEVVADRDLFKATLLDLHKALKTKFM